MYYGIESESTLLLLFLGFIITMWAQFKINRTYKKYLKVITKGKLTGADVARKILEKNGLESIYVVKTNGFLTDHYDPSRKTIKLSDSIYNGCTVASLAVAAHEVGHAIQDKENYSFMRLRALLVPIVNFITYIGYIALFISLFGGMTGYLMVSILMLLATMVFQLVTLPVEFDASKRARVELTQLNLVTSKEARGVKKMLKAAALTYVAALANTFIQIIRLLLMLNNREE